MTCTRDALAQCDLPGTRSDLDHLSDLAAKTCPASPGKSMTMPFSL